MSALLDTGFVLALLSANDPLHEACKSVMAERLHISRILTIDQRHFRLLRPSHIPAFDIRP
jgi:predicted nucleic acid-binding protein